MWAICYYDRLMDRFVLSKAVHEAALMRTVAYLESSNWAQLRFAGWIEAT
jgi:hypothetical protein